MSLRVEPLPGEPKTVALFYGPIALAGELGTQGLEKLNLYTRDSLDLANVPTPDVPVLLCDPADLLKHIEPVAGQPLTFRTTGIGRPHDVTLSPYYRLHHQRFTVYWKCFTRSRLAGQTGRDRESQRSPQGSQARIVDEVRPGEQQPETDHNLKGNRSNSGQFRDRGWRDANGGWFSYEVKVIPDRPAVLRCTYWGSDSNRRVFDILVDGTKIAEQKLDNNQPNAFFHVEYPLPANLTHGKHRVTIKFQAHSNATAGGLFGLLVLKANP